MILFDYGFTLLHEPGADFLRGERAVYPYIRDNPLCKPRRSCAKPGFRFFAR